MKRSPIRWKIKPFCRCMAFRCTGCTHKKECLGLTTKFYCIKVPKYDNWEKIQQDILAHKLKNRPICLITNKPVPETIVWDLSYSQHNLLQININTIKDLGEWVSSLIHLAERCGIFVNLVLHSIIPQVVSSVDLMKIIDPLGGCKQFKIILHFQTFRVYGNGTKAKSFTLFKKHIDIKYFSFVKEEIWNCNPEYVSDMVNLIKFYTDVKDIDLIACRRYTYEANSLV